MSDEHCRVKIEILIDKLRLRIREVDGLATLQQQEEIADISNRLNFYVNRLLLGMK